MGPLGVPFVRPADGAERQTPARPRVGLQRVDGDPATPSLQQRCHIGDELTPARRAPQGRGARGSKVNPDVVRPTGLERLALCPWTPSDAGDSRQRRAVDQPRLERGPAQPWIANAADMMSIFAAQPHLELRVVTGSVLAASDLRVVLTAHPARIVNDELARLPPHVIVRLQHLLTVGVFDGLPVEVSDDLKWPEYRTDHRLPNPYPCTSSTVCRPSLHRPRRLPRTIRARPAGKPCGTPAQETDSMTAP